MFHACPISMGPWSSPILESGYAPGTVGSPS